MKLIHKESLLSSLIRQGLASEAPPTLTPSQPLNKTSQAETLDYHCIGEAPRMTANVSSNLKGLAILTTTDFTEVSFMVLRTSTIFPRKSSL